MTAEHPQGDEPLIPMPALWLPALRQAVATIAPSRLPEFFQEIQDAFTQAGDEDSVFPIRHFYQRWAPPSPSSGGPRSPPGSTPPNEPSPTPTPLSGTRQFGSRRDRAGGLPRGRGWLSGTGNSSPMTCSTAATCRPGGGPSGSRGTDCPRIDDLPRRREFTGNPPGLRTVQRGPLMLVYLTDVRGERVVIIQVNWIG